MMMYLAYISIAFVAFQLINVIINFIFKQNIYKPHSSLNEKVSILIPARNEEQNIHYLLNDLKKINSSNFEIIVFDDQSTDNTAAIVQKFANDDNRIKLLQSTSLPKQWLGKNHACYQLANSAKGKYFLFLDADVRVQGSIIEDAVCYLNKYQLALLSAFPTQIQQSFGERISVPVMNYILLTLLPLIFVRTSPFSSHSAANGQFMLFDAKIYKEYQPHEKFKLSAVEDIKIAKYFKEKKVRIACITGDKRLKCRMYKNYKEALSGFSKNIFMFFGNNPIFAFLFWIFATLGFIPILATGLNFRFMYFSGIIAIQIMYSIISRQNLLINTLLFPVQLLFLLRVMFASFFNKINHQYSWKGRNIYS